MADNTYGERPQPRLRHNLLAGVANSIFSALVALAIVPFYLKYLGTEAYGLIGFLATIQAVLSILDMGMATTINREVARYQASGRLRDVGTLLHALAVVYWIVAGTMVLLIFLLAPFITDYWLQSKQVSPRTIMHAVTLIGIVVACRAARLVDGLARMRPACLRDRRGLCSLRRRGRLRRPRFNRGHARRKQQCRKRRRGECTKHGTVSSAYWAASAARHPVAGVTILPT